MTDTHNLYDAAKNYQAVQYRPGYYLQDKELNEQQSIQRAQLRGVADAFLKDGDLIRDAQIIVNADTGQTQCQPGAVYLAGLVRGVAPANLVVPTVGLVTVGLYLHIDTVTELDDPNLYNNAVGLPGVGQAGATRLREVAVWGVGGDPAATGQYFAVWTIENGIVRPKEPPPNLDGVTQALARYDRDSSGGSYIVSGLKLAMAANLSTGEQVYTLAEGRARVNGYPITLAASRRLVVAASAELKAVESEPHQSTTEAAQVITLTRAPALGTPQVRITSRKPVTLVHGGFAGAADPLPDASVIAVVSVKQGLTTYIKDTDYKLTNAQIDWSPSGAEPGPGSNYEVVYDYVRLVQPTDVTPTHITVTGALPDTLILVSYQQQLPRIDRLVMDEEGTTTWVLGVSAEWNPIAPAIPPRQMALASVYQTWDANRRVIQDAAHVVPMNEIVDLGLRLDRVIEDQAELRLNMDIAARDTGIKKGLFADPFVSDGMRDAGIPQTGAIVAGALRLPIAATVFQLGTNITTPQAPAYTHRIARPQPARTGSMKVNPYMAFAPLPADVRLNPAVDRWTDISTQWASAITQQLFVGGGGQVSLLSSSTATRTLSQSSRPEEFLRSVPVTFEIHGFGPGEMLTALSFDGIPLSPNTAAGAVQAANAQGVLTGSFVIPANVPAGSKTVSFAGSGGSHGTALFTGQGTATLLVQQQVTTQTLQRFDPLAQTFTTTEPQQCTGVDLWFTDKGGRVIVQLREAQAGQPTQTILAEARVQVADMQANAFTRVTWAPVSLQANAEYSVVVLCDDAVTALGIAEVGGWDFTTGKWQLVQPYQDGVLLSSSNASTWTPHNGADLCFNLLAASYSEATHAVDLGTVNVVDATDLMVLGVADLPSTATSLVFELVFADGHSVRLSAGQVISLPQAYTGALHAYAHLTADAKLAAILLPCVQLVAGKVAPTGDYCTRTLSAGANSRVKVIYESQIPGGASVHVDVQSLDQGSPWVSVPYVSASTTTAGVREITHELDGYNAGACRVRLTLNGDTAARPEVRNLRCVVL